MGLYFLDVSLPVEDLFELAERGNDVFTFIAEFNRGSLREEPFQNFLDAAQQTIIARAAVDEQAWTPRDRDVRRGRRPRAVDRYARNGSGHGYGDRDAEATAPAGTVIDDWDRGPGDGPRPAQGEGAQSDPGGARPEQRLPGDAVLGSAAAVRTGVRRELPAPVPSGDLAAVNGLARQTAVDDPTDPRNFENRRIEQAGQLAGEFIESIDFPGFVRDLTLAVFRGNLEVQHAQTQDFINLLKAATASLSNFVKEIDDFSAYARLAQNEGDRFQIALPPMDDDEDEDEDAPGPTPTLLDGQGNAVDLGDNQLRAKILDTKVAMAQENRALLREVLLMGITRMIIRKGKIDAACVFDIKAKGRSEPDGYPSSPRTSGPAAGTSAAGSTSASSPSAAAGRAPAGRPRSRCRRRPVGRAPT